MQKHLMPIKQFDRAIDYTGSPVMIKYPEDIFRNNDTRTYERIFNCSPRGAAAHLSVIQIRSLAMIFLQRKAPLPNVRTFNTTNGPIYLAATTEVWEGTHIRGAFALCNNSQVKMGAKIYGATTVGPYCRVGGEINNAVIWGYSSKGTKDTWVIR